MSRSSDAVRSYGLGPLSSQRALWEEHDIPMAFVASKPDLTELRATIEADAYYHIGDSIIDQQYAKWGGFDFWWSDDAVAEPWLLLFPRSPD